MLEPYWGEFLFSPAPLELSGNYCSHKCSFCFANLNKPDRKLNVAAVTNLLRDFRKRETLVARLLQEGYPVVVSNKVDPFAGSNYRQMIPLIETMVALEIPIAFQTRGGFGIRELLPNLPPSCWYISISERDDPLRKKIEPGSTTIESRFELIAQLVEAGHSVNVGINPLVPEWLPEPEPLLDRLKQLGVWGVWVELLHLHYKQINNMVEREKQAIGDEILSRARRFRHDAGDIAHAERTCAYANSIGLETYSVGQPRPSRLFDGFRRLYKRTFPTLQDFVNHCYDNLQPRDEITFQEYWEFVRDRLPETAPPGLAHYLGSTAHNLWWTQKIPHQLSWKQLLGLMWQQPAECKASPARLKCFAYLAKDADTEYRDDTGQRILVFTGEETNDYWIEEA